MNERSGELVAAVRDAHPCIPIRPLEANGIAECPENDDLSLRGDKDLEAGIRIERAETMLQHESPKLLVERQEPARQEAAPCEVPGRAVIDNRGGVIRKLEGREGDDHRGKLDVGIQRPVDDRETGVDPSSGRVIHGCIQPARPDVRAGVLISATASASCCSNGGNRSPRSDASMATK